MEAEPQVTKMDIAERIARLERAVAILRRIQGCYWAWELEALLAELKAVLNE